MRAMSILIITVLISSCYNARYHNNLSQSNIKLHDIIELNDECYLAKWPNQNYIIHRFHVYDKYSSKIIDTLPKGTQIEIQKIYSEYNINTGRIFSTYGEIISGNHAGLKDVYLGRVLDPSIDHLLTNGQYSIVKE